MTWLGTYGIFILIISASVFHQAQAKNITRSSKLTQVLSDLSEDCKTAENLPEKVCEKTVDVIGSELSTACHKGIKTMCDAIPWFLQILISSETCDSELEYWICGTLDKLETKVLRFARNECIEELEKIFIGHDCDADGNKVSICGGLPTTVDGICTIVIDKACDALPPIIDILTPYCQEAFDTLICREIIDKVADEVTEPSIWDYTYPTSRGFWVGL